jgi:hypothetical protein
MTPVMTQMEQAGDAQNHPFGPVTSASAGSLDPVTTNDTTAPAHRRLPLAETGRPR